MHLMFASPEPTEHQRFVKRVTKTFQIVQSCIKSPICKRYLRYISKVVNAHIKCFASVRSEEQCKCKAGKITAMKGQKKGGKGKPAAEFEMLSPG